MDDDAAMNATKTKSEMTNKVKDGYLQLAEKMEQVKNQVAKMERKYDELYQTVKGREHSRSSSMISESESREEAKSQRESIDDTLITHRTQIAQVEESLPVATPEVTEEKAVSTTTTTTNNAATTRRDSRVDIEKMENNPFL